MDKTEKIFVAGHRGMVGSAICRLLAREGYKHLIVRSSAELDLRNQAAVAAFFEEQQPDYVFLAAAKVGGILANNTYKGQFIYDNLLIQANVIHQSYLHKVKRLLFLGSSCLYPKHSAQPIKEEYLLTGPLEPTNEAYATAKIAGIKMCESYRNQYGCDFIVAMPTNLYGPGDNFDLKNSHVLPALVKKIHDARLANKAFVEVWGSGSPLREFLHVDDLAKACLFLMEHAQLENKQEKKQKATLDAQVEASLESREGALTVNIGSGQEISIKELALLICKTIGYNGEIKFDTSKPDGSPRKRLDSSKLQRLGFNVNDTSSLEEGLKQVYSAYSGSMEILI